MIVTAFTGYVPPWGQMSFWGGFSVDNAFLFRDLYFMEGLPLPVEGFGNGMPAPHQPVIPDLNIPADPPQDETPWVPTVPIVGSLSMEEQGEIARLVSFEKRMVRSAIYMLRSLEYTPRVEDVKSVVSSFILDMESDQFQEILLGFINPESEVFQAFLEDWEEYLMSMYHSPVNFPDPLDRADGQ